jgi:hypothetical protein
MRADWSRTGYRCNSDIFPDQIHGFLTMGKIVGAAQPALDESCGGTEDGVGSGWRRSCNADLWRSDLVRLAVYRGMDCSVIPDMAAIHTGRVEGQRQSTRAIDRDEPARAANCG